jgi:hypothetical protein
VRVPICAALALGMSLGMALGLAAPRARAAPVRHVAAFCRAHPTLDHPGRGEPLPQAVADVEATDWRCMDGRAWVCAGGAAGNACDRMDPSRRPSMDVREFCEDNPDADFVAMAYIANSASTWRCEGTTPRIIRTAPLDRRGFMKETWGLLSPGVELGADPR